METRRTVLRHVTGALALGMGGLNLATVQAQAQTPKRGGTLTFAISAETPHYDPHGSDTYATLHFAAPFYSTLLRFNLSKFPEVEGDLAQSWAVAPDLMSYTFKLHPSVKFHGGTPLTSADVKATYERLRNPPQGVVSTRKATFDDIGTIVTPDPTTVVRKTLPKIRPAHAPRSTAPARSSSSSTSGAATFPAGRTGAILSRACPISTAGKACSRCRPPLCSTRCRVGRYWASFEAFRRPSATG